MHRVIFGNTGLNSSRTFRVLFHCQTSSVWSINKPWVVLRALLPFYGQFIRPNGAAIRAIVTKFTLLDTKPSTRLRRVRMKKISLLYRPVLMMTINYRFVKGDDIQLCFGPKMHELNLHDMCFQQDGATCYTCMDFLRDEFGNLFISFSGPVIGRLDRLI